MKKTTSIRQTVIKNGIEFSYSPAFVTIEMYSDYIHEQYEKAKNLKLLTQLSQYQIILDKLHKAGVVTFQNLAS